MYGDPLLIKGDIIINIIPHYPPINYFVYPVVGHGGAGAKPDGWDAKYTMGRPPVSHRAYYYIIINMIHKPKIMKCSEGFRVTSGILPMMIIWILKILSSQFQFASGFRFLMFF